MRTPESIWPEARARVTEALTLRDAERRASSYAPSQAERVRLLSAAASARVAAAKKLTAPALDPVVASLLREAVALRIEAAEAAHAPIDAWDSSVREAIEATLERAKPAQFDATPKEELKRSIELLRRAERAARSAVEPRTLTYIRAARNGRLAALAIVLAWALFAVIHAQIAAPNVAFHKALKLEGTPGAVPVSELVDGETDTLKPVLVSGVNASVSIDLGGPYAIERVRVFDRQDFSFDSNLPLSLETSLDGESWDLVVRRRDHFSVWTEKLHNRRARYVRLRTEARGLALNEIEVYGRYSR